MDEVFSCCSSVLVKIFGLYTSDTTFEIESTDERLEIHLFNLKQIINILQPKVRNRTKYTCGTEALRNALNFCKTRFAFHESVTVFLKIILLNIVICSEVANLSFVV